MKWKTNAMPAWALLAAGILVSACASVQGERVSIDERAAAARAPSEHEAVAREYQAYAASQANASGADLRRGQDEQRLAAAVNQGRATRGHPSIFTGQWQLRSLAEARAAEEAAALAKEHRRMAAEAAGTQDRVAR